MARTAEDDAGGRLQRSRRWQAVVGVGALALVAEGRSNAGIARQLDVSERTVEAACAQVFQKLDLEPSPDVNRRVLAVLTLLRG